MKLPENDYQILRLSDKFYTVYCNQPYKEIMQKRGRAYNCLLFQTHYDYFICVPYRTEITHNYAYRFKKSIRSRNHKSGLDYSKIIIVRDTTYMESENAFVDKDEFNETMINLEKIKKQALIFVEDYVKHIEGKKKLHPSEFKRRYQFSTLQYFHGELGIEK